MSMDVEVINLSVAYPGSRTPVLREINLKIPTGQIVLISGPSGCGKSTLGHAMAGFIPSRIPAEVRGEVQVGGESILGKEIHENSQRVGMVFQNPDTQLIHLDVESEIAFGPENIGLDREEIHRRLQQVLQTTDISGLLHRQVEELSGGQRQRVAIAATLAMQSKILVLDEPTSDLDPLGTQEVLASLKRLRDEQGMTIVLIEHKVEEVIEWVDRVILMNEGRIVVDKPPREAFQDLTLWDEIGVLVPDVIRLASRLSDVFGEHMPLSVEDAYRVLKDHPIGAKLRKTVIDVPPFISRRIANKVPAGKAKATPSTAIAYRHTGLSYGDKQILQDINLSIQAGEWVALVGPNGSGKTSLAALAMGFAAATNGTVECFGHKVTAGDIGRQAKSISYLFQAADKMLFASSVARELSFGLSRKQHSLSGNQGMVSTAQVAGLMDLADYLELAPFQLSHGQRKRLALGALLVKQPKLIILDEPTTGQDERHARSFLRYLEEQRTAHSTGYLMITHDMRTVARYADRVLVLSEGRIIQDGVPEVVFSHQAPLAKAHILPPAISRLYAQLTGEKCLWAATNVDDFLQCVELVGVPV